MYGLVPFNRNSNLSKFGFNGFYNMLDDFFNDSFFKRGFAADTFRLDIKEDDKQYQIEAELPGVKKEELSIELLENSLKIAVVREQNNREKKNNYIHRERSYSSMARSIYLADADPENIKARLDNGILYVTVPKLAKAEKKHTIPIE